MLKMRKAITGVILMGLVPAVQLARAKGNKKVQPDYTKGEKLEGHKGSYWALGPTGAYGWFWTPRGNNTSRTRQILIKGSQGFYRFPAVEKGSPADGLLRERDVILGVGTDRFTADPRAVLAKAITEAEKKENGGTLTLLIWRPETRREKIMYKGKDAGRAKKYGWPTHRRVLKEPVTGKNMQVTLTLPVMGTYSETTPWDCPKTKAIIDKAARSIVEREVLNRGGPQHPKLLAALGLLATGEEKYLPMVRHYAHTVGDPKKTFTISPEKGVKGPGTWHAAYRLLFVTEYYLATKDEYVLPYIKHLSRYIALGRSGVGTWSHGMADVKKHGFFGPPCAYGAMNQCSETCALSLVLAQKCGIKDKEVDVAVEKATHFLLWFVDKGTIPYGDHNPNPDHDNNGRNSQAAVLFDLYGYKEAAAYFARMTLASYPRHIREGGHTGHFFAWIWGAPGAARGGKEAASSFVKNTRYFTELERRYDGRSVYQHQLGGSGNGKYKYWETTGARLLRYCLPRKQLYITGKGGSGIEPVTGDELKTVVAAGRFDPEGLSVKELLDALGSWSLVVRRKAAQELGTREENVVKELIAMLGSPNRYARYGACIGLKYAGRESKAAVKAMVDTLENEKSMTMRYFAVQGLQKIRSRGVVNGLGGAVTMAGPALLKLAAEYDAKQDPYGKLSQQLAGILLYDGRVRPYKGYYPGGRGLEKCDPDLVVGAVKAWLKNSNGGARSLAVGAYDNMSEDQLNALWPEIYYAASNPAPSGVMFAGKGKAQSTILLAENRFKEGLPLAVDYLTMDGWGKFARVPAAFDALSNYGSAVKKYMKVMQKEHEAYQKRKPREVKNCNEKWAKVLKNIDKDFDLRSIEKYLKKEDVK